MNRSENTLWISFLLGSVVGGGGLYLFGTKQGRQILKKIIEGLDSIELTGEDLIAELIDFADRESSIIEEKKINNAHNTIDLVIDKIKNSLPMERIVKTQKKT